MIALRMVREFVRNSPPEVTAAVLPGMLSEAARAGTAEVTAAVWLALRRDRGVSRGRAAEAAGEALYRAAYEGSLPAAEFLATRAGADVAWVHSGEADNRTALMAAALKDHPGIYLMLLENGKGTLLSLLFNITFPFRAARFEQGRTQRMTVTFLQNISAYQHADTQKISKLSASSISRV